MKFILTLRWIGYHVMCGGEYCNAAKNTSKSLEIDYSKIHLLGRIWIWIGKVVTPTIIMSRLYHLKL